VSANEAAATAGRWRADPRLTAYLVAGFGALILAITTGQFELAALGAPFVSLAAIGLLDRKPPVLTGDVTLQRVQVIEGDVVEGSVHVNWDGAAEVDVLFARIHGVTPVDPAPVPGWSLPTGTGPATLSFRLRAESWGVHDPGALWVRVRRPGGLVLWEAKVGSVPPLRVLPSPLRLGRLLKPAEPRAVAGAHLARVRAHGTDFAELRPYRPGDRLRDVSWATTARHGKPWVVVHHPERTGTVLLLLDAFFSSDATGTEALARAARAAWAVASAHLRAQDRVGLLAHGRSITWLPPRSGRRARWLLLDELLAVGGAAQDEWQPRRRDGRIIVPGDALIVAITSLAWRSYTRDLVHYRRIGHVTVALVIDTSDLLPRAKNDVDTVAMRIWLAQREAERYALERSGIPTALVTATDGVGAAISVLRRRMKVQRPARVGMRAR
jgi:uncharacterized protein (DUF58 family)